MFNQQDVNKINKQKKTVFMSNSLDCPRRRPFSVYFPLPEPARFFFTGRAALIAKRFFVFLEREVLFAPTLVILFAMTVNIHYLRSKGYIPPILSF